MIKSTGTEIRELEFTVTVNPHQSFQGKCTPLPVGLNKVLLEKSLAHLLTIISGCFFSAKAQFIIYNRDNLPRPFNPNSVLSQALTEFGNPGCGRAIFVLQSAPSYRYIRSVFFFPPLRIRVQQLFPLSFISSFVSWLIPFIMQHVVVSFVLKFFPSHL